MRRTRRTIPVPDTSIVNGLSRQAEGHTLAVDTRVYSLEAVKKTAYRFADRTSIAIRPGAGTELTIIFNFVGSQAENDPDKTVADFSTELLDQDLREIVKRETTAVRNLILAHAFSR